MSVLCDQVFKGELVRRQLVDNYLYIKERLMEAPEHTRTKMKIMESK